MTDEPTVSLPAEPAPLRLDTSQGAAPTDCGCSCHESTYDPWQSCDNCEQEHTGDLAGAVCHELGYLWDDLDQAVREAIDRTWSIRCDSLVDRIATLSRLVGPLPWGHVSTKLLLDGTYERLYEGMEYEPIDWQQVHELAAKDRAER